MLKYVVGKIVYLQKYKIIPKNVLLYVSTGSERILSQYVTTN